ncbi:MAG: hypothetical protein ACQBVK_00770 [Candidatus Phytoplasma sp. TWB_XP]
MSEVTNLDKKLATQLATVSKFQDAVNTLGTTFDKATVKEKLTQLLKQNNVNLDVLDILNGKYSRRSFRRNKLTLTGFLMRWVLPTLGIVIPFVIVCASKGYLIINK